MLLYKHFTMRQRIFSAGVVIFAIITHTDCVFNKARVIDETPMIITAVSGSLAVLPCSADPRYTEQTASQYKVMWVSPQDTVISLEDRRILNDMRISVERPFIKDWNLHLRNVSLTDAGVYKCQINTDPVGTKKISLVVTEPPRIIDHSMPIDVQKPEGEMVELFCNATGTPTPEISWFRLHKQGNGVKERVGHTGESLVIHNISRMCGDYYECVASNGVEPAISQTFKVTVLYLPEVRLDNTRIGQFIGKEAVLDCEVSASPLGYAVWKHNGKVIVNSQSREVNLYNNPEDSVTLSLRILKVEPEDYGFYDCEATNSLGVTTKIMELFELVIKTSPTTTTSTTPVSRHIWTDRGQGNNLIEFGDKTSGASHQSLYPPGYNQQPYKDENGLVKQQNSGTGHSNSASKYPAGQLGNRGLDTAWSTCLIAATAITTMIINYLLTS